jgi:hypothetical protein
VISGDDEGAFGWLALNYQQGRLRPHSQTPATPAGSPAVATSITSLGALDLGGSSLQITFEVPASASSSSSSSSSASRNHGPADAGLRSQYNISVAGHTFQLHLHSFKQYGLNEAYDRSITHLLQQQQEQQQEEEAALQGQDKSAQHAGIAVGNGTEAASSAVPPAKPALGDTGNTSHAQLPLPDHPQDSVAVGAAIQHGLSDALAAGAQAHTDAAAVLTSAEPQHAAAVEHQRQAELAVAAAAGYHQHDAPVPLSVLSTSADTSLDSLQASSSSSVVVAERADVAGDSSTSGHSTVSSGSVLQGSSSHAGLQSASSGGAALTQATVQPPAAAQETTSGLASPGLRLQGGQQPPAAARRRASGQLRRSLMQQQLAWLEQLLKPSQAHSSTSSSKWQPDQRSATATWGTQLHHHQQQQQQAHQRDHDVRLRQLLREYLLRDDPVPPSSATALVNVTSSETPDDNSTLVAPHPLVPADGTSSSNSGGSRPAAPAPVAVQAAGSSLSSNASSKLQVVRHPCLHEGYQAEYTRVAYEGVAPEPAEVRLVVSVYSEDVCLWCKHCKAQCRLQLAHTFAALPECRCPVSAAKFFLS